MIKTAPLLLAFAGLAFAQDKTMSCNDRNWNGDRKQFCEIREQNIPYSGRLSVDAGRNGGITVKGWNQSGVLVRARVEAWGDTEADARSMVNQTRLDLSAGMVRAQGPETRARESWSVSFEIFVPNRADLNLTAQNGGIGISDVTGRIEFDTVNGGVTLRRLGGDVKGETRNGGLDVELAGSRWEGQQLDVTTANGGVKMAIPANYSARLETGTVNGKINVDFPVQVQGDISRRLSLNLGSGGPLVRAITTNGGVKIQKI
ncbi:MAG: hypothetical protein K2X35_11275 [Bryobacteraceae bacterium]|nr:hypothetical protein [Bryobacteraceae bacterium]